MKVRLLVMKTETQAHILSPFASNVPVATAKKQIGNVIKYMPMLKSFINEKWDIEEYHVEQYLSKPNHHAAKAWLTDHLRLKGYEVV